MGRIADLVVRAANASVPSLAKLIGIDTQTANVSSAANTLIATRFTASVSGLVKEIRTTPKGSGNFKFAIYADIGNYPGALLNATASANLTTGGIRSIPIADTPITAGIYYWLVSNMDANNAINQKTTGGSTYQSALSYASAFPSTFPSGITNISYLSLLSGYGF